MCARTSKMADIDGIINRLKAYETQTNQKVFPLLQGEIQSLCFLVKSVLISQPVLLELDAPVIICGDIHGQYKDLLAIFQKMGDPGQRSYLFLGDYVDRGKKSLQCFCLLMAFKIKHPGNFFLLRGNHQSSDLNKIYGFFDQCKRKFNVKIFKIITDTFGYLPVAAVVANRVFCVHGGLSPLLKRLDQLNQIKRPVANNENRLICDLLWSDPNTKNNGWDANFERGVSFIYGKRIINQFLQTHDFDFICRSHQVVQQGYQFFNDRKLITIFSAPNYCGQFQNFGGVLTVTKSLVCSVEQFKGTLQKFNKIVRSVTPIKQLRDKSPNKQNNEQYTSHSPEKQKDSQNRKRRLTRAVMANKMEEGSLNSKIIMPELEQFSKQSAETY